MYWHRSTFSFDEARIHCNSVRPARLQHSNSGTTFHWHNCILTSTFFAPCRAPGTPLSIRPTPPHTASHHCPYMQHQGEKASVLLHHIQPHNRRNTNDSYMQVGYDNDDQTVIVDMKLRALYVKASSEWQLSSPCSCEVRSVPMFMSRVLPADRDTRLDPMPTLAWIFPITSIHSKYDHASLQCMFGVI